MGDGTPPKTWREIAAVSAPWLAARGVEEPRLCIEWLGAELFGCGRLELPSRGSAELTPDQLALLRQQLKRVAAGEPVQYVLGKWEFRGHPFRVDSRVLIPRPETELLVDLVLGAESLWRNPSPRIVDVGTGSGCIAVSLAKERPQGRYVATDVSAEALAAARANAVLNGVSGNIHFVEAGDMADVFEPASVDAIVSNPPYIPSADVDRLGKSVLDYEPRLALDGGPDGMTVLRDIAESAAMALADGGRLFLELNAETNQAKALAPFLQDLGFGSVETRKDYSGAERFLCATLAV